ncbi:MAG: hypothetical protein M3235_19850 [Actinomycetota bacterium]|nr:hypothetical protein [Actinomycetota bacterium]
MTVVRPAAPLPADRLRVEAAVDEPPRFIAYATGCTAGPAGAIDRFLGPVEHLLVPELSRISRRRVSASRSRS